MKALCINCINYEIDGNIAKCKQKIWTSVDINKSKIYNAMMFECIDHERESIISKLANISLSESP